MFIALTESDLERIGAVCKLRSSHLCEETLLTKCLPAHVFSVLSEMLIQLILFVVMDTCPTFSLSLSLQRASDIFPVN